MTITPDHVWAAAAKFAEHRAKDKNGGGGLPQDHLPDFAGIQPGALEALIQAAKKVFPVEPPDTPVGIAVRGRSAGLSSSGSWLPKSRRAKTRARPRAAWSVERYAPLLLKLAPDGLGIFAGDHAERFDQLDVLLERLVKGPRRWKKRAMMAWASSRLMGCQDMARHDRAIPRVVAPYPADASSRSAISRACSARGAVWATPPPRTRRAKASPKWARPSDSGGDIPEWACGDGSGGGDVPEWARP